MSIGASDGSGYKWRGGEEREEEKMEKREEVMDEVEEEEVENKQNTCTCR